MKTEIVPNDQKINSVLKSINVLPVVEKVRKRLQYALISEYVKKY